MVDQEKIRLNSHIVGTQRSSDWWKGWQWWSIMYGRL